MFFFEINKKREGRKKRFAFIFGENNQSLGWKEPNFNQLSPLSTGLNIPVQPVYSQCDGALNHPRNQIRQHEQNTNTPECSTVHLTGCIPCCRHHRAQGGAGSCRRERTWCCSRRRGRRRARGRCSCSRG